MLRAGWRLAGLTGLMVSLAAAAQDRSACVGIYCPQGIASDTAAELAPYMALGKTWERIKGQTTLVMKYYNRDGTLASTLAFPQSAYLQATPSQPGKVAFAGQGTPTISLFGLSPCRRTDTFVFSGERFTCDTLWREQLNDNLFATQAVLCRAYVEEVAKPVQEATCLRADEGSGRLSGGIVIDDTLVGLGSAVLARDASGKALRPELAGAEKTGAAILAGGGR